MTKISRIIEVSSKSNQLSQLVAVEIEADFTPTTQQIEFLVKGRLGNTEEIPKHLSFNANEVSLSDEPSDLIVRVCKAQAKALPIRKKTICEIRDELLEMVPDNIPVIYQLWWLVVHPISLIIRAIGPTVYDLSSLHDLDNPHHQDALLTALKWSREALDLSVDDDPLKELGEEFTLVKQFKEAEAIGEALKNKSSKEELATEYSTKILQRLASVANTEGAINLMLLPIGYWTDSHTYQPMLLAFYKNTDGQLALSEMTYGSMSDPIIRDYTWEKTPEDLTEFLETLLLFNQNPNQTPLKLHRKDLYKFANIELHKKTAHQETVLDTLQQNGLTRPASSTTQDFFPKLAYHAGASPSQTRKNRRQHISENPFKIVQETLRLQFPEAPGASKELFTLSILNDRLKKILTALPEMSQKKKEKWLQQLEHDRLGFERQLRKAHHHDEAYGLYTDTQGPFKKFAKRLEKTQQRARKTRRTDGNPSKKSCRET